MERNSEVLIVGGGPAGLMAAMTLGRMGRSALVCDDARPRNAPSSHVNNFPTRDGIHPAEWRRLVREDLRKYDTIQFRETNVVQIEKIDGVFRARFLSGETRWFKKVILAEGVRDRLPGIPGFQELWGNGIFHCPFCHGFEVRGTALGLIASGEMAAHMLPMIYTLSADLILFTQGEPTAVGELRARWGLEIVEEPIAEVLREAGSLRGVKLAGGREIARTSLFFAASPPFEIKSNLGAELGCKRGPFGFYEIGLRGETNVPGVFACGDSSTMGHSVLLASASGVMAGAGVVAELANELSPG